VPKLGKQDELEFFNWHISKKPLKGGCKVALYILLCKRINNEVGGASPKRGSSPLTDRTKVA
jgi:hypothetical protein